MLKISFDISAVYTKIDTFINYSFCYRRQVEKQKTVITQDKRISEDLCDKLCKNNWFLIKTDILRRRNFIFKIDEISALKKSNGATKHGSFIFIYLFLY